MKLVPIMAPEVDAGETREPSEHRPTFFEAISVILLPVVLMLAASMVDVLGMTGTPVGRAIAWVGTPL